MIKSRCKSTNGGKSWKYPKNPYAILPNRIKFSQLGEKPDVFMLGQLVMLSKILACSFFLAGLSWGQWPANFVQQDISPNSTYLEPTSMAFGNEGSVFISERAGNIKVIEGNTARTVYTVSTTTNREQGLLKIQVHPRFNQTGWLYLYYITADYNHHNLGRLTLDSNNNVTRVDTLVRLPALENTGRHNGGGLVFGNDGLLYLGRGNDELGGATNPAGLWTSMKGKILRFTENGLPAPGNPHYNTGGASVGEQSIWARGFRNPWTMGVDRISGRLFVGDVGDAFEEMNDVTAPTASEDYWYGYGVGGRDGLNPTGLSNTIDPLYLHNTGANGECAIVSTVPYHANVVSNWPAQYKDRLYFSDYCRTMIRSVPLNPPATHTEDVNIVASGSVNFGSTPSTTVGLYLAPDGDLYFAGFALGQNLRAYRIHYNIPNAIAPQSHRLNFSGSYRVGNNSGISLSLPYGYSLRDGESVRLIVTDQRGKTVYQRNPTTEGGKLRLEGFNPGRPGVFFCRLSWTAGGKAQRAKGLITVWP